MVNARRLQVKRRDESFSAGAFAGHLAMIVGTPMNVRRDARPKRSGAEEVEVSERLDFRLEIELIGGLIRGARRHDEAAHVGDECFDDIAERVRKFGGYVTIRGNFFFNLGV